MEIIHRHCTICDKHFVIDVSNCDRFTGLKKRECIKYSREKIDREFKNYICELNNHSND